MILYWALVLVSSLCFGLFAHEVDLSVLGMVSLQVAVWSAACAVHVLDKEY